MRSVYARKSKKSKITTENINPFKNEKLLEDEDKVFLHMFTKYTLKLILGRFSTSGESLI